MAKKIHPSRAGGLKKTLATAASNITLAPALVTRKLDLASGQRPREGFEGVDLFPGAKHVVDLSRYPWTCQCEECNGVPFADNSVAELNCAHYIEHIPMEFLDKSGNVVRQGTPGAKEALFMFFDECYRILVPDGWLHIVCPTARSNRGYQDPTHRRFIVQETFFYLNPEWRRVNQLDHYNVVCDFGGDVGGSVAAELNTMHPEASNRHFNNYWNCVHDWIAKLKAFKPAR